MFDSVKSLLDYILVQQTALGLPSRVTFELTPFCNFHCPMCYVRKDKLKMHEVTLNAEKWLTLAQQAKRVGVINLCMTGGEIFTLPEFRDLYERVYDMGFFMCLISNGYLLDEATVEWLAHRKPRSIKITLYGASNETYQRVCGVPDGFDRVTAGILRLQAAGIRVRTCMTVIRENEDDLEAVFQWARQHELPFVYCKQIKQSVYGEIDGLNDIRVAPDYDPDMDEDRIEHETDLFYTRNEKPFSGCNCYRNSCIITWDGRMIGCNFVRSHSVNALEGDFVENFRRLWDSLDTIKTPEKCVHCKYLRFCNPCPGALEGQSGDPEVVSPYVCAVARENYQRVNLKREHEAEETKNCEEE